MSLDSHGSHLPAPYTAGKSSTSSPHPSHAKTSPERSRRWCSSWIMEAMPGAAHHHASLRARSSRCQAIASEAAPREALGDWFLGIALEGRMPTSRAERLWVLAMLPRDHIHYRDARLHGDGLLRQGRIVRSYRLHHVRVDRVAQDLEAESGLCSTTNAARARGARRAQTWRQSGLKARDKEEAGHSPSLDDVGREIHSCDRGIAPMRSEHRYQQDKTKQGKAYPTTRKTPQ